MKGKVNFMEDEALVRSALDARKLSYAPYSGFLVGAALLCRDGTVYQGCNIENAAYTPSNCAERTAFFTAVRDGKRDFKAIAVAGAIRELEEPEDFCAPCGVCLQVMAEFCDPESFRVILVKNKQEWDSHLLKELLPFGFQLK